MFEQLIARIKIFFQWYVVARYINNDDRVLNQSCSTLCAEDLRNETVKKIETFNWIRNNCDETGVIYFLSGMNRGAYEEPFFDIIYIDKVSFIQMKTTFSWCRCCSTIMKTKTVKVI